MPYDATLERATRAGLLTGPAVFAGVFLIFDVAPSDAFWPALFFALLTSLAVIDGLSETVPDTLTLALAGSGLAHTGLVGAPVLLPAVIVVLLIAVGLGIERWTRERWIFGSGDLFLFAGIAAWFGPVLMIDVLLIAAVALALHCIVLRQRTSAFAPSLLVASYLVWFGGPIL